MGLVEFDMPLGQAAVVFTKLTIGDGLVTQVPAFLISLASGLLVTRTSNDSDMPNDIVGQLFVRPEALGIAALFLGAMSFTGLPRMPLLFLAGGLVTTAVVLSRSAAPVTAAAESEPAPPVEKKPALQPEDSLFVDPMELELGYGLIRLADSASEIGRAHV